MTHCAGSAFKKDIRRAVKEIAPIKSTCKAVPDILGCICRPVPSVFKDVLRVQGRRWLLGKQGYESGSVDVRGN